MKGKSDTPTIPQRYPREACEEFRLRRTKPNPVVGDELIRRERWTEDRDA